MGHSAPMIVREEGDGAICVGQASHAWVSGQLARRWGNGRFARPDPFDEVCLGAEQHDVGMAEWDLVPELDPETGLPRSFMSMPLATHLELWSQAARKVVTQSPYAALIVSMHGAALYSKRDTLEPDPEESASVRRFLTEQEALQAELLAAMDEEPQRARHNQRLIWALDFLSLAPLMGWAPDSVPAPVRPGEPDVELSVEPAGRDRLTVEPWPFGEDEVETVCHGRRLSGRFGSQEELDAAMREAPWVRLSLVLARA